VLAVLDLAGLSTNLDDIKDLLFQNQNLQKIAVDNFASSNSIHIYDRNQILDDAETLIKFSSRRVKPVHRSQ
jgi:hypothetical protein